MIELIYVNALNSSDIPLLNSSHFFNSPRKEIKENVEKLKQTAGKDNVFLAKDENCIILCGFSDYECNTNQAKIWILLSKSINLNDSSLISKAVSYLLYEGFNRRKYHKLTICLPENHAFFRQVIENYRWKQEGILADNFIDQNKYVDGIMFAIMENDFYNNSTGMIPFLTGYLIIQATNEAVFNISIIKKVQDIPGSLRENIDYIDSICGPDDILLKPADIEKIYASEKAYPYLLKAMNQMKEYIQGERSHFDLKYEFSDATQFQKKVWNATAGIPFGQTRTYEEIAQQLDMDNRNMNFHLLSRAVGTALGKNPIMIAVPCHRVIGKDGKLKGFAGGIEVKDYLLSHEILFSKIIQ